MFPNEAFCLACRKSKNYTDLEEHNWFYEYNVHKAFWLKESKETIKEVLSNNIDTPPVDVDKYIDNAYKNMIF
jgi:cobalamin biosynthesis Co2+ chelatase CbiK